MKSVTIPTFLRIFYPSLLWQMPTGNKRLYLTFDDGPHPEITPSVLDLLDQFDAKATFFCVGENVLKYPETYQMVIEKGHLTGNHAYNHLNGWKTPLLKYYENVNHCRDYVDSKWFRPPYGRITPAQIQTLKKEYSIVMWTILSYDFDKDTNPEQCTDYVLESLSDGAIIVFHDSEKAARNMLPALKNVLEVCSNMGYRFMRIDE
ncbi:MAG: polysaccharide deacetylase family protein [Bacteroidetes bacterium HGW-Bacteroidetes-1]|nr:MAG: polysaccharide deacetylase family protein [Bacteroidetes bacterium HGW-Bacteroidetes-1]